MKNPESLNFDPEPAQEELESARKVIAGMLLARKNYALYPEGHVVVINSVEQLHKHLETHFLKYGNLRLDIEKDQLLTQDKVIFSEPSEEGSLPFVLFRDGIRWLEFKDGIDAAELLEFLKIINKYSMLSDEPDGDIVTAFWETQLSHIQYEVADFFWGPEQQDAELMPFPDMENQASLKKRSMLRDWTPLPDPPIDPNDIVLSTKEYTTIKEMVFLEEKGDPTGYLDALLDSLLQDREQESFEIILEVLEEEFKNSLGRKDFSIALKILQSLQYVVDLCSADIPWAIPLVEDFVLTVSSAHSLGPLQEVWSDIEPVQYETLGKILRLLQPEAVPALGEMLLKNQSAKLRQMLLDVIILLSSRDIRHLEALVMHPDEKLMERLVPVFVSLEGERSGRTLMKLVHHKSAYVRQEVLKAVLKPGTVHIKEIFSLIDDRDESIRRLILKHLGQGRDRVAEDLLLRYMESGKLDNADSGHVIACYTALGLCGSSKSLPFLRQTLLGSGWLPSFHVSVHREGAAVALSRMSTKEAQEILEKAGRSLSPGLRRIVRKVR